MPSREGEGGGGAKRILPASERPFRVQGKAKHQILQLILPIFSVVRLLGTIRAVIAKEIQLCNTTPPMRRKATFYPVAGSFQGARVVLEAIGRDEQEAINKLEGLLLRFRDEEGGG